MKQKIRYALLYCCFMQLLANAQAPDSTENALLWRISGNGLKQVSYLYGTIHLIPKKDFSMNDSIKVAFAQADRVAFEIDLDKVKSIWGQLGLLRSTFMKGDTTLEMLLNKKDYALVKLKIAAVGLPMSMMGRIKPMFLSSLLEAQNSTKKDDNTSYEMEFYAMANAADKTVEGLETAKYQMSVFDTIPYRVQAQMLVDGIRNKPADDGMARLVELYTQQDLTGLSELFKSDNSMDQYSDVILNNRNRNWIPVMQQKMKKHSYFFAVGAGHLIDEKGVIALLRKAGYTLKPIFFKVKK